ncbi:MAG: DUF4826 family protein [Xanthomonadales bacterium]|nr:DUF4826 family protein [Xanthomonadales bacterium]
MPLKYDDPELEERWCMDRRQEVESYLSKEQVPHGRIGEWPAWHVAPYVSIWAIESQRGDEAGLLRDLRPISFPGLRQSPTRQALVSSVAVD